MKDPKRQTSKESPPTNTHVAAGGVVVVVVEEIVVLVLVVVVVVVVVVAAVAPASAHRPPPAAIATSSPPPPSPPPPPPPPPPHGRCHHRAIADTIDKVMPDIAAFRLMVSCCQLRYDDLVPYKGRLMTARPPFCINAKEVSRLIQKQVCCRLG